MFSDTGKLPAVDYIPQDKDHVMLKYKNDIVRISPSFLQKLVSCVISNYKLKREL